MSPRQRSTLFDVTVKLLHETPGAWLVSEDGIGKIWIPKSMGELEPKSDGDLYELTAPEWFLKDKGLI